MHLYICNFEVYMKKLVSRVCGLGVICIAITVFLNTFFIQSRKPEITIDNYHSEHTGLQLLDDNTVDVLYIGSSHVFSTISPEDIFMKFGMTGYVLSSSCQRIWQSYYYMMEALETQSPKCVVVDTFCALDPNSNSEAFNREAIDPMRMGKAKLEAVKTVVELNPEEENWLSYLFPVMRYHDRWESLEKGDFEKLVVPNACSAKGFLPRIGSVPATFNEQDYPGENATSVPEICKEYLDKIVAECKQRNIKLVLVKYPTCMWDGNNSLAMQNYAKENEIPYLDFNANEDLKNEAEIDWSVDSLDGGNHLNYDGAMKLSPILGKYLSQYIDYQDKRENTAYKNWIDDYAYYKACVKDYYIQNDIYFSDWAEKIDDNYMYAVCNTGISNDIIAQEDMSLLNKLGSGLSNDGGNIGVLGQKGEFVLAGQENGKITDCRKWIDKLRTTIYQEKNPNVWNVYYERQTLKGASESITFLLIDKVTGKKVDFVSFKVDDTGRLKRVS